jgi:hypothetical protein
MSGWTKKPLIHLHAVGPYIRNNRLGYHSLSRKNRKKRRNGGIPPFSPNSRDVQESFFSLFLMDFCKNRQKGTKYPD